MLERVKTVPREAAALIGLSVVIVAAAAYFYSQGSGVDSEIVVLKARLTAVEVDRDSLAYEMSAKSEEVQSKKQELEVKQTELAEQGGASQPKTLTSRREAADLSGRLIAFAAERELDLGNFDTEQTAITLAETEFPAYSYSLAASGAPSDLIGLLDLVEAVATARVDRLELGRDDVDPELWRLTVAIIVMYQEEG